jgi:serine acetyltransferase
MHSELEKLRFELRVNKSLASKLAILLIRLERVSYFSWFVLPFRVVVLNFMFNTEIPKVVKIGKGLRMPHPFGILVHPLVSIGSNASIFQFVTIGVNEFKQNQAIEIGDDVYIGATVSIISVSIPSCTVISAHALVTKDIPAGSYVFGRNETKLKEDAKSRRRIIT